MIYSSDIPKQEEPKQPQFTALRRPAPPEPEQPPSVTIKKTSNTEFGSVYTTVRFDAVCDETGEIIRSKTGSIYSWEVLTSRAAREKLFDFAEELRKEGYRVSVEN